MSLAEILEEIPKLSFADRQEVVRKVIGVDEGGLTAEDEVILDERMADFRRDPSGGVSLSELEEQLRRKF